MINQNVNDVEKHKLNCLDKRIEKSNILNNSLLSANWLKRPTCFERCCETAVQNNSSSLYYRLDQSTFITEWSVPILQKKNQNTTYTFVPDWAHLTQPE